MHFSTDMMLPRLYGHCEIRTSLGLAHPCSVQPEEGVRTLFLDEVDQGLPRIGLGQRVLGFVQLHIEAGILGTAGRCRDGRRGLGKRRCRKKQYDDGAFHVWSLWK